MGLEIYTEHVNLHCINVRKTFKKNILISSYIIDYYINRFYVISYKNDNIYFYKIDLFDELGKTFYVFDQKWNKNRV